MRPLCLIAVSRSAASFELSVPVRDRRANATRLASLSGSVLLNLLTTFRCDDTGRAGGENLVGDLRPLSRDDGNCTHVSGVLLGSLALVLLSYTPKGMHYSCQSSLAAASTKSEHIR